MRWRSACRCYRYTLILTLLDVMGDGRNQLKPFKNSKQIEIALRFTGFMVDPGPGGHWSSDPTDPNIYIQQSLSLQCCWACAVSLLEDSHTRFDAIPKPVLRMWIWWHWKLRIIILRNIMIHINVWISNKQSLMDNLNFLYE